MCGWPRSPCNAGMPWTKSSTAPPFVATVLKSRGYRWQATRGWGVKTDSTTISIDCLPWVHECVGVILRRSETEVEVTLH